MGVKSWLSDVGRVAAFILASTMILTANFIGVIAAISGEVQGLSDRIPWYILAASIVFVTTIVLLERNELDGRSIIITAPIVGVTSFVLMIFGSEGVRFGLENPDSVFMSEFSLYFIAAGLIATGLGYWGVRHWREFVGEDTGSL